MNFKLYIFAVLAVAGITASAALNDGMVFSLDLSKGDANGNGRADASEISDRMTVSAATPLKVSKIQYFENDADFSPITISNMDVVNPWFGFNSETNSLPCLYFPQSVKTGENGTVLGSGQYVNFSGVPVNSSCSVYLRFKWDGNIDNTAHNCFIAMNGYAWSSNQGWGVGLYTRLNYPDQAKLMVMVGKATHNKGIGTEDFNIKAGQWYDVIYTFSDLGEGKCEAKMWLCKDYGRCGLVTSTNVCLDASVANPVGSYGFWFGGENLSSTSGFSSWTDMSSNKAKNVFRGAIADVKIWNRVLDAKEVDLVFSGFTGEKWSIGAANGSNAEFAKTAARSVYKVDVDKWTDFPGSLDSSCNEVTVSYPLREREVRLPQVLTVVPVLSDGLMVSCPVEISVNGTVAGSMDLAKATQFRIKKRFVLRDVEGRMNVKIRRLTSNETLGLDALSLSGSFRIGDRDNKNSEFTSTRNMGQLFIIGDGNDKHFVDALWHNKGSAVDADGSNTAAYSNACIRAWLPAEAARAPMTFRACINCRANTETEAVRTIAFYVNGVRKALWVGDGKDAMQEFSYTFEANEIPAGFVDFMLSDETVIPDLTVKNRWAYIDYVQLDAVGFPNGTVFLLR